MKLIYLLCSNQLTLCIETYHIRCVQFDKDSSSDCTDLRIAWSNLILTVWNDRFSISYLDIKPANVDSITSIIFCLPLSTVRNKEYMQGQQFPGGFWLSILFIHRTPVTLEPESNCYGHIYGSSKVNDIRCLKYYIFE